VHSGVVEDVSACASYDEKDTALEKLLRRTAYSCRNVTIFAGHLSKATGQLMLTHANGVARFVLAIFI
jgi:hypothetical protein